MSERERSFEEGWAAALHSAAMIAHDMGHPDVRHAINQLLPEADRPIDTPDKPMMGIELDAQRKGGERG
jgi:hypothetical protein